MRPPDGQRNPRYQPGEQPATNQMRPRIENEADLMVEALVREIGRAGRWSAMVDAWQAILTVRRVAKAMEDERSHLAVAGAAAASQNMTGFERECHGG